MEGAVGTAPPGPAERVLIVSTTNVTLRAIALTLREIPVGCLVVSLPQAVEACAERAHVVIIDCARQDDEVALAVTAIAATPHRPAIVIAIADVPDEEAWRFWCAAGATQVLCVQWLDALKDVVVRMLQRMASALTVQVPLKGGGTLDLTRGRYVGLVEEVRLSEQEHALAVVLAESRAASGDGWASAERICERMPTSRRPDVNNLPAVVARLREKLHRADGTDGEPDAPSPVDGKRHLGYRILLQE